MDEQDFNSRIEKFGLQYVEPYEYCKDMTRPPIEQFPEARRQLRTEMKEYIQSLIEAAEKRGRVDEVKHWKDRVDELDLPHLSVEMDDRIAQLIHLNPTQEDPKNE